MTVTEETGTDLSVPPWSCYICGWECGFDEWSLQTQHTAWHSDRDGKINTLQDQIRKLESDLQFERNNVTMLMAAIGRVEKVIGTEDNYRFALSKAFKDPDANDPF